MQTYDDVVVRQARKLAFHFITDLFCANVTSTSWRVNRVLGFPSGSVVKNLHASRRHRRHEFDPWFRKIPWRRARQPTLVFLPGKSYGQRRTQSMGSQKGRAWLEWLTTHTGKQFWIYSWHIADFCLISISWSANKFYLKRKQESRSGCNKEVQFCSHGSSSIRAPGQGPLEWSNMGSTGYRAEIALYQFHCWTPWPTIIGLQDSFPHSRLRGEFAVISGLVLELGPSPARRPSEIGEHGGQTSLLGFSSFSWCHLVHCLWRK